MNNKPFENKMFQTVGDLFTGQTNVLAVAPSLTVNEALELMISNRYSQLIVTHDGQIEGRFLGVFSLWSLAHHLYMAPSIGIEGYTVEDMLADIPQVTVKHSINQVMGQLIDYESLIISSGHGIQAIATLHDGLRYFYNISRPFILIGEIELALRQIILNSIPNDELASVIKESIGHKYRNSKRVVPSDLREISFDDYRAIIVHKNNFNQFSEILGKNRKAVDAKLKSLGSIRNKALHFRDGPSVSDYHQLNAMRELLFLKLNVSGEENLGTESTTT